MRLVPISTACPSSVLLSSSRAIREAAYSIIMIAQILAYWFASELQSLGPNEFPTICSRSIVPRCALHDIIWPPPEFLSCMHEIAPCTHLDGIQFQATRQVLPRFDRPCSRPAELHDKHLVHSMRQHRGIDRRLSGPSGRTPWIVAHADRRSGKIVANSTARDRRASLHE